MSDNKLDIVHKLDTSAQVGEKLLYDVLTKTPTIPSKFNLNNLQKHFWRWFAKEFVKTNQFTQLDLIHLQKAAIALAGRSEITAKINELNHNSPGDYKGYVQKFKGGAQNISPWLTVMKQFNKDLEEVSSHFGLSFRDRKNLGETKQPDNQLDLFESFNQKYS